MSEGNKSGVSGDGLDSKRPATNFPGISVDSNRFNCLVEKSGLGVEPRRLLRPIKLVLSRHIRGSALSSGRRGRRFKSSHPDHFLYEISRIKNHIQLWSIPSGGDSTLKTINPFSMATRMYPLLSKPPMALLRWSGIRSRGRDLHIDWLGYVQRRRKIHRFI